ncbi:MAG: sigma-54-dependent Fis family transcriptional regulator [Myxococcales bacterium]|nr:sigma-54-dependent Fis family transcriptional regulator [Myxococcales bacterium]
METQQITRDARSLPPPRDPRRGDELGRARDECTLVADAPREDARERRSKLALTIVFHPDPARVGEWRWLDAIGERGSCRISRSEPEFGGVAGQARPIDDRYVSRRPLVIDSLRDGSVRVWLSSGSSPVRVDGAPLVDACLVPRAALEAGVLLELASRVILLLHAREEVDGRERVPGMIGESDAILRLQGELAQVAELPIPVLLRGESGTGKELAARAIHAASARSQRPCVCVNMAAIHSQTAVGELFGYRRGAFTGAIASHRGLFGEADGGTIFLDEIGEAPADVQAMLLRVLETGELQPLGGDARRRVDVRLIAATDRDLERAVERGHFRLSLLHRLASYEVWLPPLRRRRDDIARLFVHFLRVELARVDQAHKLAPAGVEAPWLPAWFMARVIGARWPGNIRQLRNLARQLVVSSQRAAKLVIGDSSLRTLARAHEPSLQLDAPPLVRVAPRSEPPAPRPADVEPSPPGATATRRRSAQAIREQELVDALRRHEWRIAAAAEHLGTSKSSLYKRIQECPRIRVARDLTRDELESARERHRGSLEAMSSSLEVSVRGLQLRMRELGVDAG